MPVDAEALAELVDTVGGPLRAFAATWSDSPDDLVQEAFCRLVVRDGLPERPRAWLFQVVRNLARERARSHRRRQRRERRAATSELVSAETSLVEAGEVAALVDELEPELREVLVARLWGDLTLAETAKLVGTSIATVHRRYRSALETLQRRIEPCPATHTTTTPTTSTRICD